MTIVYIAAGLLVLILGRAATMSPEMKIERSIRIRRPVQDIFDFVVHLRNHRQFNKWTMTDPNVQIDYTGNDAETGFSSHWKSEVKSVGEGIQKIASVEKNSRISYDLTFIKPFANSASSWISFSPAGDETIVSWGFSGPRNFSARIMHTLLNLEKMLGKDLDVSLRNLKTLLEK